jgi:CheY-like chemotaxis protein
VPRPAYAEDQQPELEGKRVLIVDDNATNREILSRQAASWGMVAEAEARPADALVRLQRGDAFDVAVLDMQMPEMDGLTLAHEIRQLGASLPLILATSLGGLQQARSSSEFAVQLTKPVKASQFYEALLEALGEAADLSAVAPEDSATAGRVSELRILVAEDNAVNQRLAMLLLAKLGYSGDLAENGLEVLDALARERYDVVLMDMQMPELDGLGATHRILEQYGQDRPRIIAMTANAMQGDREACLAAGMDDYVAKPIRPEELTRALARCAPHGTARKSSGQ